MMTAEQLDAAMRANMKPVTADEIASFTAMLRRYPSGVSTREIERRMGIGGPRIRKIAHTCRARCYAPIINTYSDMSVATVYKIAVDDDEFDTYIRSEERRIANQQDALDGLRYMRQFGPKQQQRGMFGQ